MPLPLPNLDTRRWTDLVDEGRALIPRYAPTWTDHNIHDPGITLMELMAWLVEQDIYRVNRVPDRYRRKFLALVGFAPNPPSPARVPLTFTLASGEPALTLPAGTTVATGLTLLEKQPFQTTRELTILPASLTIIQTKSGTTFSDRTRLWRDGLPFPLLGDNPAVGLAVSFGFDQALPVGTVVSLWFWWEGERTGHTESQRIIDEGKAIFEACQPVRPEIKSCSDSSPLLSSTPPPPLHHSVQTVWEYFDGIEWKPLDSEDETHGLTLDGNVILALPGPMVADTIGVVTKPQFYLRWRLVEGRPDATPMLRTMALNTVETLQTSPARSALRIAAGVTPPAGAEPIIGNRQRLKLQLDPTGMITGLVVTSAEDAPQTLILDYQPATVTNPGSLITTLYHVGQGDGFPNQKLNLPDAPIADGEVALWTAAVTGLIGWRQQLDLDASHRTDADFSLDATRGTVTFGDGEKGRVPSADDNILARFSRTNGADGNVSALSPFYLLNADDDLNAALFSSDVGMVAAKISQIINLVSARDGTDEESVSHAAGRAAESLWAHERLVELCTNTKCTTLDQLDRALVLNRAAPPRATTLLDYERLAFDVPGTQIQRVRAWAGIDPAYPCLQAPGTVTVVIVPGLPEGRPQPTVGLLEIVHRYLHRRRIIGTRLIVTGPDYVEVTIQATVKARARVDSTRVQSDIIKALNEFLDPLSGGPKHRGWPFGRDVYRSEILQVIDNVTGVDHVLSLDLLADHGQPQCSNLCVGITGLVTPGTHTITIEG